MDEEKKAKNGLGRGSNDLEKALTSKCREAIKKALQNPQNKKNCLSLPKQLLI